MAARKKSKASSAKKSKPARKAAPARTVKRAKAKAGKAPAKAAKKAVKKAARKVEKKVAIRAATKAAPKVTSQPAPKVARKPAPKAARKPAAPAAPVADDMAATKPMHMPPMHHHLDHPELDDEPHGDEVFEIFKTYDSDDSGSIDRNEFARLCEALGMRLTEEEQAMALEAVDSNHSGRISWQEFKSWWNDR